MNDQTIQFLAVERKSDDDQIAALAAEVRDEINSARQVLEQHLGRLAVKARELGKLCGRRGRG